MTVEKASGLFHGSEIFFAGRFYKVAKVENFPHGILVGIYDEPPTEHIDYLNPESIYGVLPCTRCQGGGCLDCKGQGKQIQLT